MARDAIVFVDAEAEAALIGAIATDPATLDAVDDVIAAAHFSVHSYRRIYEAVKALRTERKPVDPVTVRGWFIARGELSHQLEVDFASALASAGVSWNARAYAEQLRDAWASREVAAIGDKLWRDPEGTVPERIDWAIRKLQGVEAGKKGRAITFSGALDEQLEKWEGERERPDEQGSIYPTGFPKIDRFIGGLVEGDLAVFSARPGSGKSSLTVALASNYAVRGIPVGLFWLEDSRGDFVRRVVARRMAIRAASLRHGSYMSNEDWAALKLARADLAKLPIHIDDTHGLTATEIATRMRFMAREHGVKVFFADHLGEIRVEREDRWGDRHDLALGRAARVFRDTAKEVNACAVLLVQANRQAEKSATPKSSDLADSGHIEQAARIIGFCTRPKPDAFHIAFTKNTNGKPTGVAECKWLEDYMTVENS